MDNKYALASVLPPEHVKTFRIPKARNHSTFESWEIYFVTEGNHQRSQNLSSILIFAFVKKYSSSLSQKKSHFLCILKCYLQRITLHFTMPYFPQVIFVKELYMNKTVLITKTSYKTLIPHMETVLGDFPKLFYLYLSSSIINTVMF